MSMFVAPVSFWRQNQSWSSGQASANDQYFGTAGSLFGSGNAGYSVFGVSNPNTQSNALVSIGSALTDYFMNTSILAARQGNDRINKAAATKTGSTSKPVGNVSTNASFSGSLAGVVNFGADGPSASGGYQFVAGTQLTDAFKLAMLAERSNGSAIDTVSVTGDTLTASTSGKDAHTVFTLTLHPNSGLWTFTLVNPIDGRPDKTTSFITALNLSGLMQGVKSNGQALSLPNNITVSVYGDQTYATGTATQGSIHQGGLVYTPSPAQTPAPVSLNVRTPYQPPVNPATGHYYVTTSSIAAASGSALNVLA
jgi:hypothetical protein